MKKSLFTILFVLVVLSVAHAEIKDFLYDGKEISVHVNKYYDIKSKESVEAMMAMVEPLLLILAASFLLMIVCAFILPVYTNMNQMGSGGFK